MCGYCAGHGCNNQWSFDEDDKGNIDGDVEQQSRTVTEKEKEII